MIQMLISTALGLATATAFQDNLESLPIRRQDHHGYPLQGLDFGRDAARMTFTGIVRADGERVNTFRPGWSALGAPFRCNTFVESATVLGSSELPAGTRVKLVIDASVHPSEAPYRPLIKGQNYAVLANQPRDGKLFLATLSRNLRSESDQETLVARDDTELAVLNLFETRAAVLDKTASGLVDVLASLLTALESSSSAGAARIAGFLDGCVFPGQPEAMPLGLIYKDSEYSRRLKDIIARAKDPALKARASEVLLKRQFSGGYALYVNAIMDVAANPLGYFDPTDLYDDLGLTLAHNTPDLVSESEKKGVDQSRINELGLKVPSSRIREFFITRMMFKPTNVQVRAYVQLLSSESQNYVDDILFDLPFWTKTERKDLAAQGISDRKSAIAYWQHRFPANR